MLFFFVDICFHISWVYTKKRNDWVKGKSTFNFLKTTNSSQSCYTTLHSHQKRRRAPISSMLVLQHLLLSPFRLQPSCLVWNGFSLWFGIKSSCYLRRWVPCHMLFGHLYIFLDELLIQILCPFLNYVVFFIMERWDFFIYSRYMFPTR